MSERNDLTQGSILGKLFRFFFPVLLGMLFQQLYNTVDAVVVGRGVGSRALAAVGGSPAVIINLVIGFFTGLASGASVIISQYFGSGDQRRLSEAEHTVLAFSILIGGLLTILGWLLTPWALCLVKTPEDILADSVRYMRIYFLGTIPLLLFNVGSGILRAVGDSRRPLWFLSICCALNIVLDLGFVTLFRWGVAGVAWATVLSLGVSASFVLVHLRHNDGPCHLQWQELRIRRSSLRRILYIGLPSGVQSAMYSLSNILIQASVNSFGTTTVAAWTAVSKFDGLYWVTSSAFGVAICTFTGQCFGAREYDRMRIGVRQWTLVSLLSAALISGALLACGPWGLQLFSSDEAVLKEAMVMMWCFVPYYVVWVFVEILSNALRGAGDSIVPMVICLVGVCVLRILWILLVVPRWNTIVGVSYSYPVTWGITALTFLIYYHRGRWLNRCLRHTK